MDTACFNSLTRSLTDTRSRRAVLAVVLGGTLSLLGRVDTAGKTRVSKGKTQKRKHNNTSSVHLIQPPVSPLPSAG